MKSYVYVIWTTLIMSLLLGVFAIGIYEQKNKDRLYVERTFIEAAKKYIAINEIKVDAKIYYLDILDIRDTLALDENSNIISEKRGTDEYYVLLALFNDVLDDYELTDKDGNKAKPNEKRIYAPNVVKVENGIPVKLTTGLSDKQIGAYDELTDQMNQDMYNKLSELMK